MNPLQTSTAPEGGVSAGPTYEVAGVPVTFVADPVAAAEFLEVFASGTEHSLDTETYNWQNGGIPKLRVVSAAAVVGGVERAWVVDCKDLDKAALVAGFEGLCASGWNASYDEGVFNTTAGRRVHLDWFDAMLADSLTRQGELGNDWYRGLAAAAKEMAGIVLEGKGTTQTSYDESTPLTDEQIRYAALDAVATMRVARVLRERLAAAGLDEVNRLEQGARPFLAAMKHHGLPIDWDGWLAAVAGMQEELDDRLAMLAELTGGGQADIFTMVEKPVWNPDSTADVKRMLNQWHPDLVRAYFEKSLGESRLFEKADKADKDTLRSIGGPLCEALLGYRDRKKVISTYGENLSKWIGPDGRMHPEYVQALIDTGRLASRNPNAQNFTPLMKKFFAPLEEGRVFAYADLSQAELRFLAEISGDQAMRQAFIDGRDIHVATAERMFGVKMDELQDGDPKKFKEYRSKAKTLNFGIVYGLGPTALANSLTLSGVETTVDEAKQLLAAYLEAYLGVKAWLGERDQFVRNLSKNPPQVDFEATLALRDLHGPVKGTVSRFRKAEGREPDDEELLDSLYPLARVRRELADRLGHEPDDTELAAERDQIRSRLAWVRGFRAPVVLGSDGSPIGFTSYTKVGRQRRFQILTDSLLLAMCTIVSQSRKDSGARLRDGFARTRGIELSRNGRSMGRDEIAKVLEDRALRRDYVDHIVANTSPEGVHWLVHKALGDRISAMGNAFRNAPIQGGVADVALDAYGRLWAAIRDREDIFPVQTVHDSITLECDETVADEVAQLLKSCMEEAMTALCPNVPAKADADIRTSLDDGTVVREL